jgi:flavorubredoxin
VGAVDWASRNFHGYATTRGTTYNAYLILADKVTLIDTVKAPFKDELLSRIASVIEPNKIDYIISNHSEMDHSGSLPEVIEAVRPEKVFASANGAKALPAHFHGGHEIVAVKDGENLSLGNVNLSFLETRMLHWPDSMFTYLAEEEILFSQDAFGMHLASTERFDDEIQDDVLEYEAAKYYANILLPLSSFVLKLLDRVDELGLKCKMVLPDHGPIWRTKIGRIVQLYGKWAAQRRTRKAVIVYDTMWQSTAKMAAAICDGLMAAGVSGKVMPLGSCHRSEVATEILDAGALLVGSPTLNNNMFPTVSDLLTYLKGLKPRNLIGAAFGSYGWSGEAAKQIQGVLEEMKVDIVGDAMKVRYVPHDAALAECRSLGELVAAKVKERFPE